MVGVAREAFHRTPGQRRCSKVVGDDEGDAVVHLVRRSGGGVDREGIELLQAGLGVDVGGGLHGRNDLGTRGSVGADGGRCLHRSELLDCLVDGVDRWLEVHGGGDAMDLTDTVGGVDLGRALRRTCDGHHRDAHRGCIMGDRGNLLGLGGGAGDVRDGRRRVGCALRRSGRLWWVVDDGG